MKRSNKHAACLFVFCAARSQKGKKNVAFFSLSYETATAAFESLFYRQCCLLGISVIHLTVMCYNWEAANAEVTVSNQCTVNHVFISFCPSFVFNSVFTPVVSRLDDFLEHIDHLAGSQIP